MRILIEQSKDSRKKYERSGVLREFKARTQFIKPSIEKRMARIKAARRQHKIQKEQD